MVFTGLLGGDAAPPSLHSSLSPQKHLHYCK